LIAGVCPKLHSNRLKKDYEILLKEHPEDSFEREHMRNLEDFLRDCNRKIEMAQRRLDRAPDDTRGSDMVK